MASSSCDLNIKAEDDYTNHMKSSKSYMHMLDNILTTPQPIPFPKAEWKHTPTVTYALNSLS